MTTISAVTRPLPGTGASVGTSGGRSVVVDRPEGVAGGAGLGFNGGQLLALALAGCLANDLRYAAPDPLDPRLDAVRVHVDVDVEEGRVTGARVRFEGVGDGAQGLAELVRTALAGSTVLAAVRGGLPVQVLPG
ncbi:OsmC family protein [Kineococcus aurantiacus]|uniref:OsmC family protein n=1 Tax=Kineococcus aurantiacus TaxID=37633 RepID=UPI0031DD8E65